MDWITEQVADLAADAVDLSEWMQLGVLDYTESSLVVLDKMADALTPDQRSEVTQHFGCYLLEVARRAHGGRYTWIEPREQPALFVGEPAFRIVLLAWDIAGRRLSGDQAGDLSLFYRGFADRVRRAVPGDDALYE